MPTYDGIGSSVTHEIEVVGDVFISNVEGGSLSTQVPFEIFSNVYGMATPPTDSRQVRLRVQSSAEASPDNSYVTDMGIQNTTDNYFFITAPQNTSNVGDQNTFVISKTSNVGIGTTDPEKPLHVVGDSWITGTLTASNIIGASPVTISSSIVMAAGTTLTTGAIEPPSGVDSNMNVTGTLTTSNIVANTGDNLLVSSNLEVGTSNLFVDTATGRVGIGVASPIRRLDVRSGDTGSTNWISGAFGPELSAGDRVVIGNLYGKACIGAHNSGLTAWADLTINSAGGRVGIGTVSPSYALHVQSSTNPQMLIGNSGGGGHIYFGNGNHGVGRNTGKINFTDVNDVVLYTAGTDGSAGLATNYANYYLKLTSGGVVLHNGSTVHSSDDRIKINEERITNATETLMKLDPQIYDKTIDINSSNVFGREAGLIIQDVWYDAPELRYLVLPADDANPSEEKPQRSNNIQEDPDYSDWGSKSGHFNYTGLIPYLIKSNQEQQALIENLKARIESFENSS
jgi:hypothetical protein